jgi:hypothetical protein
MQFIHMNDSVFVWISLDGSFSSLNLAMPSRFVTQLNHGLLIFKDSIPIGTTLFGDISDPTGKAIAQRVGISLFYSLDFSARKTGMQCFVSCNIPQTSHMIIPLVERRIFDELKAISAAKKLATSSADAISCLKLED